MKTSDDEFRRINDSIHWMRAARDPWWSIWQSISDYFLPRRYPWVWLGGPAAVRSAKPPSIHNSRLLDSTSSHALKTLATGMMNGITSPARPWFRLTMKNKDRQGKFKDPSHEVNVWLEKSTKIMHTAMGGTNFYNSLGIMYLEWAAFGTASMGIYEDFKDVFICRNYPVGGFMIGTNANGQVDRHAREFNMTLEQVVERWPDAQLPMNYSQKYKDKKFLTVADRQHPCHVKHLVEPNKDKMEGVRRSAEYREIYWLDNAENLILAAKGLDEFPHITPRWETYADDVYGSSPCIEAMPDVMQLQHLVKRKAQGLDKMIDPPILAHASLATKQKAFLPGGITYVSSADLAQGARPTYQINVPFQELHLDVQQTQGRIKEVLFNDLFRMISDLQTVRSASEIVERKEEKLVLLGPVLERFESEGLRPSIERIFGIMLRADLFPPLPEELEDEELEPEYTGVLSDAMRSVGTIAVERWLAFLGNVAQMAPETIQIPDFEEVIRYYADAIGVPPQLLKPKEESQQAAQQGQEMGQLQQAATIGKDLASGAQQLSATDVGGGANALQAIMGAV